MKDYDELRRAFAQYVRFSDEEWARIKAPWRKFSFATGEVITCEGEVESHLYFICSGIQRLYFLSGKGEEVILGFAYDGNFSGVFDSMSARRPSPVYLEALTPCRCLGIAATHLDELYDRYKSVERWGRLFVTDILTGRGVREVEMTTLSAEERYRRFIARQPDILQQVPQKYLASYLGMTPETFSRLRAKVR